jgi:hypothetical protein
MLGKMTNVITTWQTITVSLHGAGFFKIGFKTQGIGIRQIITANGKAIKVFFGA